MASYKLWEIPQMIDVIDDMLVDPETGEVLSEDEARKLIDELEMEKDKKLEYICKLIKNKTAEQEMLKAHKQSIDKRIKAAGNSVESLKKYIQFSLSGKKWSAEDGSVNISYRTTKDKVFIDNLEVLPEEAFRCPHIESNVSKTYIKEQILNGSKIPGAHLEDSVSVVIK